MKLKVKVKNFDGTTTELEKEKRSLDHLKAQQMYPSRLQRNKKKYTRKKKHKNKNLDI